LKLFFEVKKDIKKDARISPDTVVTVVNVNIKMIQKWKIKMYIFQDLFLSLCFHKGSFFF
jgi:transposase